MHLILCRTLLNIDTEVVFDSFITLMYCKYNFLTTEVTLFEDLYTVLWI